MREKKPDKRKSELFWEVFLKYVEKHKILYIIR